MNHVITVEQAKKITGGRTPLVPVEYEAAVKALEACLTLDEAKYWSDKADALAAWAKIFRSDDAGRKARALKLHAFRRMGQLARELRPGGKVKGTKGEAPGARSLLQEQGLTRSDANNATYLAKIDKKSFASFSNMPRPPSPGVIRRGFSTTSGMSAAWKRLSGFTGVGGSTTGFLQFVRFCRNNDACELARGVTKDEARRLPEMVAVVTEWLDEFERHLPKAKP